MAKATADGIYTDPANGARFRVRKGDTYPAGATFEEKALVQSLRTPAELEEDERAAKAASDVKANRAAPDPETPGDNAAAAETTEDAAPETPDDNASAETTDAGKPAQTRKK